MREVVVRAMRPGKYLQKYILVASNECWKLYSALIGCSCDNCLVFLPLFAFLSFSRASPISVTLPRGVFVTPTRSAVMLLVPREDCMEPLLPLRHPSLSCYALRETHIDSAGQFLAAQKACADNLAKYIERKKKHESMLFPGWPHNVLCL